MLPGDCIPACELGIFIENSCFSCNYSGIHAHFAFLSTWRNLGRVQAARRVVHTRPLRAHPCRPLRTVCTWLCGMVLALHGHRASCFAHFWGLPLLTLPPLFETEHSSAILGCGPRAEMKFLQVKKFLQVNALKRNEIQVRCAHFRVHHRKASLCYLLFVIMSYVAVPHENLPCPCGRGPQAKMKMYCCLIHIGKAVLPHEKVLLPCTRSLSSSCDL
jgi:hypothetical protein